MTFLDLFAGVGGFRRGMELAGHKCLGFCEWDKFARASYISMHCITEEQREYLATLDLKKRQKEILKDEYLNGEWCSTDIRTVDATNIPKADCWCFGAPCQDFSIAGLRKGLDGDRSSLIREVLRILEEIREEDRPEWLIYENVKGMLSSNQGFDFLSILLELDARGYDTEWQILNSKLHRVPQNRYRVYTIGHLRRCGSRKIFPLKAADGEDCVQGVKVSLIGHRDGYRKNLQTYSQDGITGTLDTAGGGGREHHVAIPCKGVAQTLDTQCNQGTIVTTKGNIPSEDKPGYVVEIYPGVFVWAIWYEKYECYIAIRKLTPRECFRLQGWTDDYFDKAQFVNSDSQLYKQAGNGVTVNVVNAIGKLMS